MSIVQWWRFPWGTVEYEVWAVPHAFRSISSVRESSSGRLLRKLIDSALAKFDYRVSECTWWSNQSRFRWLDDGAVLGTIQTSGGSLGAECSDHLCGREWSRGVEKCGGDWSDLSEADLHRASLLSFYLHWFYLPHSQCGSIRWTNVAYWSQRTSSTGHRTARERRLHQCVRWDGDRRSYRSTRTLQCWSAPHE